jgi:hypothetical protein
LKVEKCGAGEGWRRSVGPIVEKMKSITLCKGRKEHPVRKKEGRLTGFVTSCVGIAF